MGYYDALPSSFSSKVFSEESGAALSTFDFGTTLDAQFTGDFGVDTTGQFDSVANALSGVGALATTGWTFITAPEDVSWDVANQANRVDIFGTNNPPVVAGTRGMRDLTLGNALVEGFVRGVTVEGKISALENLMSYGLNTSDGFVSVPVYQVWANNKSYGGSEAYYVIKDIRIKESMRDLRGDATRAYVDISLMQVPAYQVNSGRDQANQSTAGAAALNPTQKAQTSVASQANQKMTGPGGSPANVANAKPSSGPKSATPQPKTPKTLPNVPISTR